MDLPELMPLLDINRGPITSPWTELPEELKLMILANVFPATTLITKADLISHANAFLRPIVCTNKEFCRLGIASFVSPYDFTFKPYYWSPKYPGRLIQDALTHINIDQDHLFRFWLSGDDIEFTEEVDSVNSEAQVKSFRLVIGSRKDRNYEQFLRTRELPSIRSINLTVGTNRVKRRYNNLRGCRLNTHMIFPIGLIDLEVIFRSLEDYAA